MNDATIEVSGLRKRFGPTLALDGMSFAVQPGQVTGFVGPNGAGKPNIGFWQFFAWLLRPRRQQPRYAPAGTPAPHGPSPPTCACGPSWA